MSLSDKIFKMNGCMLLTDTEVQEALDQESNLLNQYILGRFSWNVLIERRNNIFGEKLLK